MLAAAALQEEQGYGQTADPTGANPIQPQGQPYV